MPDGGDMHKSRGLVITPLDEAGRKVAIAVRRALHELGIESYNFDEMKPGASWANAISDAIGSADFIVADISGSNSNVLYELGQAHVLRKPSILLRSWNSDSPPPFALSGYQYISYDSEDLARLQHDVQREARRFIRAS
jgi:TIR domain